MASKEEIREGIITCLGAYGLSNDDIVKCAVELWHFLDESGVVLKVDRELPEPNETCPLMQGRLLAWNINLKRDGYVATERLI